MAVEFLYILSGIVVGFLVGVTGVGGGSLMTPILMVLLNIPAHIAIGTDLLYAAISKFFGSLVHAKKLNIVWSLVFWLALGSIPASLGTHFLLDHYFDGAQSFQKELTLVIGGMLTLTGISIVFRHKIEAFIQSKKTNPIADVEYSQNELVKRKKWSILLMGIVLGVLVTLSSVGAGAFGIMVLVLLFPQLPMIRIIGSDVVHAVMLTLVAGIGHLFSGNVDFHLLTFLLIGSIPAIMVGVLVSSKLPERAIRLVLGITILLLGINFMLNPVKHKANHSQIVHSESVINNQ